MPRYDVRQAVRRDVSIEWSNIDTSPLALSTAYPPSIHVLRTRYAQQMRYVLIKYRAKYRPALRRAELPRVARSMARC